MEHNRSPLLFSREPPGGLTPRLAFQFTLATVRLLDLRRQFSRCPQQQRSLRSNHNTTMVFAKPHGRRTYNSGHLCCNQKIQDSSTHFIRLRMDVHQNPTSRNALAGPICHCFLFLLLGCHLQHPQERLDDWIRSNIQTGCHSVYFLGRPLCFFCLSQPEYRPRNQAINLSARSPHRI